MYIILVLFSVRQMWLFQIWCGGPVAQLKQSGLLPSPAFVQPSNTLQIPYHHLLSPTRWQQCWSLWYLCCWHSLRTPPRKHASLPAEHWTGWWDCCESLAFILRTWCTKFTLVRCYHPCIKPEREEKWRWNWRMEWVASTLHTTLEHGVYNITTNNKSWCAHLGCPRRFKWTRPFRRKTKYGFCVCAITFQLAFTKCKYRTAARL